MAYTLELEKIDDKIKKLWEEYNNKVDKLKKRKYEIEINGLGLEGKYVKLSENEYMLVKLITFDNKFYRDNFIFSGVYFSGSYSSYEDENFFEYDAMKQKYIEKRNIKDIKEITREEFIKNFNELSSVINKNFKMFLNGKKTTSEKSFDD